MKIPQLAVIIPCYNEELCIKHTAEMGDVPFQLFEIVQGYTLCDFSKFQKIFFAENISGSFYHG